jgi:hypothetical protein
MQTTEGASHILGHCQALTILRFRNLGCHFMKQGAFEDIPLSEIYYTLLKVWGFRMNELKGCTKD